MVALEAREPMLELGLGWMLPWVRTATDLGDSIATLRDPRSIVGWQGGDELDGLGHMVDVELRDMQANT